MSRGAAGYEQQSWLLRSLLDLGVSKTNCLRPTLTQPSESVSVMNRPWVMAQGEQGHLVLGLQPFTHRHFITKPGMERNIED